MLLLVVLLRAFKVSLVEELADVHVHASQLVLLQLSVRYVERHQRGCDHQAQVSLKEWEHGTICREQLSGRVASLLA